MASSINRVFYLRKHFLWLGSSGLVLFVAVGVASAYAFTVDPPANPRIPPHIFAGAMLAFWSFWAGVAVWILLAYWREKLSVEGQRVIQKTLNGERDIDLSAVTELQWRFWNQSLRLRTATAQIKIHVDNFEPEERLWLIRFFRIEVSELKQEGWDRFCYRVANPVRRLVEEPARPLKPDEVLLNRWRWDWCFLPTTVIAGLFGIVAGLWLELPRLFAAPLLPIFLWLGLRFLTPNKGIPVKRMPDREVRSLTLAFIEIGVIALVAITCLAFHPRPAVLFIGVAAILIWCVHFCYRHDVTARKQRESTEAEERPRALQEWDARQAEQRRGAD